MAKKEIYDVVIVGAGVSGLMLSKLLNKSKLKVLLVEKRNTIKKLVNYRYGTLKEAVDKFNLQKYVIKKYKKATFGISDLSRQVVFSYPNYFAQIVDMNLFAKDLKLKCDVHTSFNLKSVSRIEHGFKLFDGKKEYFTKMLVDCSGHDQIVSKLLGRPAKDSTDFINISLELSNCNIPDNISDRFLFPQYRTTRNMLLWIYPYSRTRCQFGQADLISKKILKVGNEEKSIKYIMKQEPYKNWFKNAKINDKIERIASTTITRPIIEDNLITCGEAAGATTPILGEGFRISLDMADYAYKTVISAFEKGDLSKRSLKGYEREFYKKYKKYYPISTFLRFLEMRYVNTKEYDMFSQRLKKLNNDEFIDFVGSKITWRKFFKLMSLALVFSILINVIKYHVRGKI
ncbi:MAG: NAD(P)/FAD-dependent oxidoreductase [Candidatus Woesearchaeota archaeon]